MGSLQLERCNMSSQTRSAIRKFLLVPPSAKKKKKKDGEWMLFLEQAQKKQREHEKASRMIAGRWWWVDGRFLEERKRNVAARGAERDVKNDKDNNAILDFSPTLCSWRRGIIMVIMGGPQLKIAISSSITMKAIETRGRDHNEKISWQ